MEMRRFRSPSSVAHRRTRQARNKGGCLGATGPRIEILQLEGEANFSLSWGT